ncbi:MAG: CDP-diacylglycerol--glycerol-3-phosphate 3-phosphatidyltransferase [Alcanivoracaceae bacterium]|nr:CDP-diacylglycerol--glycerol-3-phosphate 3-phosphatidyltransferase [Alcanivoracaceae bacterium]
MSDTAARLTLPNLITLARLLLIPVFVAVFYMPYGWAPMAAAGIFLLAGLTDLLDGYLARRLNQTSRFGAFLDPVADKLMVAAALVLLVQAHATIWLAVPALVIISREITVSALREWMAEIGQRARVAVSSIGKIKTVLQISAITGLLAIRPLQDAEGDLLMTPFDWLTYSLLYAATFLTLWSMFSYLRAAWPELWPSRQGR